MKRDLIGIVALFILLAGIASADEAKPNIVILATGGTIAGSAETQIQAGYTSGQVGVDVLIGAVPQLKDVAEVSGEQVANVGSQDMSDAIWLTLTERINEIAKKDDVDGLVITHGTDTIEETGYFLNLTVKTDKPVVMTAAMRPSTALSADGPLNIFNAVAVAADPQAKGRGVLIVTNDDIHGARGITKTST
ncbi:MAG: L-asparaginase 2, partial [bacterium]|nr:L-asparaginase 2 [bacterium]